ncbi:agamous-like MADS-box protein MADS2 isoform X3 [Gossypium hirsutum]|uniref:Agamous-like MADS-box protein MADS2 isoform X3 n=1 Tax=Gossypium hirsutum TaxID=3635 RepID=A0A1U8JVM1_GOSHI|nr:agamous-like MADS-box protein MADS2 isoform X3 [Gossypium hirsutum]XP_040955034.1 agamous-like MADS-box protein MADS2 isoform X3 [Gossypium hirsutum]
MVRGASRGIAQKECVDSFFSQNSFISYDTLHKLGISQPIQYLLPRFPEGIPLVAAFVHPSMIEMLDAAIEDAIERGSCRNLLGEDLGPLNSKELEQLEHQLAYRFYLVWRTQYMLDQLSELQNKEQMLMETNRALSIKLEEISARNQFRVSWEGGEQSVAFTNQQAQYMGLFQPLECNPTLQIGIHIQGARKIVATHWDRAVRIQNQVTHKS